MNSFWFLSLLIFLVEWTNKTKHIFVICLLNCYIWFTPRWFFLSLLKKHWFLLENALSELNSDWVLVLLRCVFQALIKMSLTELYYSLPLTAREARWHLFLSAVRAHCGQTDCGHPGGQKPEEDGCWWPVRWVQFLSETVSWRLAQG